MGATAAVALCLSGLPARAGEGEKVSAARARVLARLVRHDCGSCHGMTLRGGLGPPLTPAALRGRPAAALAAVIAHGRGERAMPGWAPILRAHEVEWIAEGLLDGRFLVAEPEP